MSERVGGATSIDRVADQLFLPIVRGQDGNIFGLSSHQSHENQNVLVHLGTSVQILGNVRVGHRFSEALEVVDVVDQLEIVDGIRCWL